MPEATYRTAAFAALAGVTVRALHHYDRLGLLRPKRTAAGYRVYTHRDRTRLKLTLRGKRLGLSLSEVKQLVDMYESPADTAQQLDAFLHVLQTHRVQLEQQLEDIEVTLAEIAQHEARCKRLLAEAGSKSKRGSRTPA